MNIKFHGRLQNMLLSNYERIIIWKFWNTKKLNTSTRYATKYYSNWHLLMSFREKFIRISNIPQRFHKTLKTQQRRLCSDIKFMEFWKEYDMLMCYASLTRLDLWSFRTILKILLEHVRIYKYRYFHFVCEVGRYMKIKSGASLLLWAIW